VTSLHHYDWGRTQGSYTMAAICLALLAVDWSKRTSPTRASRVSMGHLAGAGIVAVVLAAMLEAAPEVVIGVLCGTCLAVQIGSTWTPRVRSRQSAMERAPGAAATTFDGPPPRDLQVRPQPVSQDELPAPARQGFRTFFVIPTVFQLVRRIAAAGRSVAMFPVRLLFHLVTFVLTAATMVLCVLLAFDLPGLLASGRLDPRIPQDMQRAFGVENWPFVLRSLGGIALFVLACLALLLIMWVRRSRGSTHLLRGAIGAAIMFATPFVLAHGIIEWTPAIMPTRNGWAAWQEMVQGVSLGNAFRAAIMFVGAMVLLLWPATRKTTAQPVEEQQASATDSGLLASAHK
jgi:hypothetical protein